MVSRRFLAVVSIITTAAAFFLLGVFHERTDDLATLVGLELRPRRSRDAAGLWASIDREVGSTARDAVWDHPDLLPGTEDLDDPAGYSARRATAVDDAAEVDRALAEILGEDPDADPPA